MRIVRWRLVTSRKPGAFISHAAIARLRWPRSESPPQETWYNWRAAMATPTRQIRRVTLPLDKLVEFIDRQTTLLTNTRLHNAQTDIRSKRVVLYIESDTDHPVPLDLILDWDEIFGTIPCAVCGQLTPVERIVTCTECSSKLLALKDEPSLSL
jgi:hypothetical protein